ncbi:uncharacterized protein LOC106151522 [Lingula anatina]|uniref:Uncharacterized protein LOC106151522 n=1 Tax=Lingula anatina TaxID=7574 RepID=A0A1S3H498_LINAN|nr:uncharacterized protein LOC106151522 [Lingula anatina]|eukprot:XP_013380291.1 uncharacterized protein LOC106151522 [Lingula anatina]
MSLMSEETLPGEKESRSVFFAENAIRENKKGMSNSRSATATAVAVLGLLIAVAALVMVVIAYARPKIISPKMAAMDMDMMAQKVKTNMETEMSEMVEQIHEYMVKQKEESKEMRMRDEKKRMAMMEGHYTFAYNVDWKPQYYIDQNGFLKGQGLDMMKEICKMENKNCTHVVNYDGGPCWNSMRRNAPGLQGRWFDGCVGFIKTVERSNVFAIVGSMYEPVKGAFFTKVGATVDIGTARIGFDSSYYTSPACLTRNGVAFDASAHVLAETYDALETHLNNDSIDAIFAPENQFPNLQKMATTYDCAIGKGGVMVRKDMAPRMMWIHRGLEKMKRSGKFREQCENALRDHGAPSICVSA